MEPELGDVDLSLEDEEVMVYCSCSCSKVDKDIFFSFFLGQASRNKLTLASPPSRLTKLGENVSLVTEGKGQGQMDKLLSGQQNP